MVADQVRIIRLECMYLVISLQMVANVGDGSMDGRREREGRSRMYGTNSKQNCASLMVQDPRCLYDAKGRPMSESESIGHYIDFKA